MITVEQVRNNPQVRTYIQKADEALAALGYTEHSFAHVGKVAKEAREILLTLGYSPREAELAEIAGWLHDIGNVISQANKILQLHRRVVFCGTAEAYRQSVAGKEFLGGDEV